MGLCFEYLYKRFVMPCIGARQAAPLKIKYVFLVYNAVTKRFVRDVVHVARAVVFRRQVNFEITYALAKHPARFGVNPLAAEHLHVGVVKQTSHKGM